VDDDDDDEWWYREREARMEWVDSNAARRQAAWLFISIVFIFLAVAMFTLGMWLVYNVIFVPGR
jgi:polyferredoxin